MPIKKVKVCDVCRKQADFYPLYAEKEPWFIVNVAHVYCSEECWEQALAKHESKERKDGHKSGTS